MTQSLFGFCFQLFSVFVSITQFSDFRVMSYENWKHILAVFSFHNSVFNGIFVNKHTCVGPTIRVKSHQRVFWSFLQRTPFTLHTTRSQLHFHTTTSPSLPLPCPHLLTHVVTDRSSANPCCPNLENTILALLYRSSSPTSFSTFSPLRRYFIHLTLIYTSDLLVIWWYFAWFRSISTHNGWLMVGCLLLCLNFFFLFFIFGFSFLQVGGFHFINGIWDRSPSLMASRFGERIVGPCG